MKHINELSKILNYYLNWNKARVTCLAQMVRSIIAIRTVNLSQIAVGFCSKSKHDSNYKRIQPIDIKLPNTDKNIKLKFIE